MRTGPDPAAGRIGRLAVRALLREVSAAPKPGLVDRFGSGSHDDMDFMTFCDSALALGPAFAALAGEGLERGAADPAWAAADDGGAWAAEDAAFLSALRVIGLDGERRMFAATGGVNTHKGALFLVGLLAASAGALVGAGKPPSADRVRAFGARIVRGLSERELPGAATHGARAFRDHGSRGVRGEAEDGLPCLDGGALRILRKAFSSGRPGDADCVDALLRIMLAADDTTVLHRGGADALEAVRRGARETLDRGGARSAEGKKALAAFSAELVGRRLSPGGSADLLAAGLFLAELERAYRAAPAAGPLTAPAATHRRRSPSPPSSSMRRG